jgi:hypothetical protein
LIYFPLEEANSFETEVQLPEVHTIGDAKSPRKAMDAIREGYLTNLRI